MFIQLLAGESLDETVSTDPVPCGGDGVFRRVLAIH
jgi:hypothetical protein